MSLTRIQNRRDTLANWTAVNPLLAAGEIGIETDTNKMKIGNGSTLYTSLPYAGADAVLSVFGRIGGVVSDDGDYTASQVTNVPAGNLDAIEVQAALNELQSDVDTRLSEAGGALTGPIQFPNNVSIFWRNFADTADVSGAYLAADGNFNWGHSTEVYQHRFSSSNGIVQIGGGQGNVGLATEGRVWIGGTGNLGAIYFGNSAGVPSAWVGQSGDATKFHLSVGDFFNPPKFTFTSAGFIGIGNTAPTAPVDISGDIIRVRTAKTPATSGAAGNQGDIAWDADNIYVCIATNTWKRSPIATW